MEYWEWIYVLPKDRISDQKSVGLRLRIVVSLQASKPGYRGGLGTKLLSHLHCSAAFQIPPPRLDSMTGIQRRQVADIVVIIHFFLLFFLFLLSLSHLSFLHPPPSTCPHSTLTTTLTLA